MKDMTVPQAEKRILRNGGDIDGKTIIVKDVGLKTWAAVDFLVNHNGYRRPQPDVLAALNLIPNKVAKETFA